jgi:hypothetical protein
MCVLDQNIWSHEFNTTARCALRRAFTDLDRRCPVIAKRTLQWLALRCDPGELDDYFIKPQSLPLLALPWWLEKTIHCDIDIDFQADLMCSTINGYYFSRMLDDLMDGHELDRAAVPALYPFYKHFLDSYFKYFKYSDPFWSEVDENLMITAEAASSEATIETIREAEFLRISARKTAAGVIPMAAVCFRYGRLDLLDSWKALFVRLSRWHQMRDDVLDWNGDHELHHRTWLLSEAERQRADRESISEWMGREGFGWAHSILKQLIREAIATAEGLGSPEAILYLKLRQESFDSYMDNLVATAAAFRKLLQLDSSSPT